MTLPDVEARGASIAAITPDTGAAFAAVKRDTGSTSKF